MLKSNSKLILFRLIIALVFLFLPNYNSTLVFLKNVLFVSFYSEMWQFQNIQKFRNVILLFIFVPFGLLLNIFIVSYGWYLYPLLIGIILAMVIRDGSIINLTGSRKLLYYSFIIPCLLVSLSMILIWIIPKLHS